MSYNPCNPRPLFELNTHIVTNYSKKPRLTVSFPDTSEFTKQEFRDECDINTIMSKYQFNGEMPVINERVPQYLDVTGQDFQDAMYFVANAQSLFNELPSSLRNRFQNDPAHFLDFCSNDNNRDEMASLGLLKPQNEWAEPPDKGQPIIAAPAANMEPTSTPNPSPSPAPK